MKRFAALAFAVCFGVAATPETGRAALIPADIVFIIDTSGSMGDDINQVKSNIVSFNTAMVNAGIDAQYALVRFGGSETLIQQLTTFAVFNQAGSPFQNLTANGGGVEEGSDAINVALSQVAFRPGSVKNFILITDEDDDSSAAAYAQATAGLLADQVLMNVIGNPNDDTGLRYQTLAQNNGGMFFNILDFRNDPGPFFDNFTTTKVREIIDAAQVPEPATMAVFGLGALAAGGVYRRNRKSLAA